MQNTKAVIDSRLHKHATKLMGNRFEFTIIADTNIQADALISEAVSEIKRIEFLLTTFSETSQTNLINRNAGISPVKVDDEVFDLIRRCQFISSITQGAFDITYGSADKRLWNFDQTMTRLPNAETAKQSVKNINYKKIILDEKQHTVFLQDKGMRIGFGGIGKGYAAEKAKQVLCKNGVTSGIVNAAGDLTAWGYQPDGKPWTIGIADPNAARDAFSFFNITNTSIATSGNYEKFILIDGKRYSHTINPKTGLPVQGIKSVTIVSPNAELADAMATPVMIMGVDVGLDLINQITGLGCIIIDDQNKIHTSKNIHLS